MQTDPVFLWLTVFVATLVELIEALTIVLALGITRGWRSVLFGSASALITLCVVVVIFYEVYMQVSDDELIPIKSLWVIVGSLLLVFGLQWTKKSILRIGGVLKSRDEDKIFKNTKKEASRIEKRIGVIDWYSFVMSYKAVLLEGFEVIFIVIIFGSMYGDFGLGMSAVGVATVAVVLLGLVMHRPLSKVPENWLKLTVGVMLVSFGTYFSAEGVHITWPLAEWSLVILIILYTLFALFLIQMVKGSHRVLRANKK